MATASLPSGIQTLSGRLIRSEVKNEMELFAVKVSLMSKIFGCNHGDLSRPFSHGKIGYRSCLKCGAVRQFNPETLKTYGEFYYPSVVKDSAA